ncbi:hypothetical protein PLESTB_001784300 [Pleodorina starrii]|uniref:Uncharacterized protein n=1 Tax=Pleodorina starrii TaxID=330485 RepID=A0A9W6C1X2_9CHLO|nr:hypothetical protein PLESTB_001784300 [Pleodorina starrii]GLC76550.1 hypothetical protein PLESTF_001795200 [Pleodorina starrii]
MHLKLEVSATAVGAFQPNKARSSSQFPCSQVLTLSPTSSRLTTMLLTSLPPSAGYQFRAPRNCARAARSVLRPPCGVLANRLTSGSSESFVKRHQEVQQDSEWYGPEQPDHPVSPAAVAAAPATAATRGDVRLMTSFTKFLKSNKLDLSALFCSEAVLSADSQLVCDPRAGHHTELLSEFLVSGALRVGEELPHWFVNGNMRGAIKCWMATRPAAAVLAEVAAGNGGAVLADAHPLAQRRRELAAAVSEHAPAAVAGAAALVDNLLAAMPVWSPGGPVAEMAGWEPAAGVTATAEDVALLHCFGALVYGSRLDVAVFLQQLCGADPFSWAMAQVAQGVISEPEPWLLERFFMSRHTVGEALPLWFAKWGVREEIGKWLRDPKAAELVQKLLEARGVAADGAVPEEAAAAAAGGSAGAAAASTTDPRDDLANLEASAAGLLCSALLRHGVMLSRSLVDASLSCRRDVRLYDSADAPHSVDLLATCSPPEAALVAVAVQVPCGDDDAAAEAAAVVRQAKERLEWLCFLLRRRAEAGGLVGPQAGVAKVLLLRGEGEVALPESVVQYLEQSGVLSVWASELPLKDA